MNTQIFSRLILCGALIMLGCSKDTNLPNQNEDGVTLNKSAIAAAASESNGAQQLQGIGYFDAANVCDAAGNGASYAVLMEGDLQGCLLTYIDEYDCSPSGTYREIGREHFIGTYKGEEGEFWTNYKFEARYEGCSETGAALGLEIFGRCQHPVAEGTGTDVFEGVSGILLMKDDIAAGNYPYRGHLRW